MTCYYLPDGDARLHYLGDPTLNYGGNRQNYILPIAATMNMVAITLIYLHYCDKSKLSWLEVFLVLEGDVAPDVIQISDAKRINHFLHRSHTVFVISAFGCVVTNAIVVMSWSLLRIIYYDKWTDVIAIGMPWMIYQIVYAVYAIAEFFLLPTMFHILCVALEQRFQQLNEEIEETIMDCKLNEAIGVRKRRRLLKRLNAIILSHKASCTTIRAYNLFFSEYLFIVTIHLLPMNTIFRYQLMFTSTRNVFEIGFQLITATDCAFYMLLVTYSAALVSTEVRKSYRKLMSLVVTVNKVKKVPLKLQLKVRILFIQFAALFLIIFFH